MRSALALLLCASAAAANPLDLFGFGARGPAMGNAQAASAQDASAGYYNPAGLALSPSLRIDFGARAASPSLTLDGAPAGLPVNSALSAGLVAPTRIGGRRLALGLMLSVPGGSLFRFSSTAVDAPRFLYWDNRPQRLFVAANLAVELGGGLFLGGGVSVLSRSQGRVHLQGEVALSHPALSSLSSSVDVGLFGVRYPQAGLLWAASDRLSLGLTYRHSFRLEIDQNFRIDGSLGDPHQTPLVAKGSFEAQTRIRELFQPAQLTLGAALRPWTSLLVTADLCWARWSQFPAATPLAITIDLGPALNPLLNLPAPAQPGPPGFRDLLVPRLGLEWRAHDGPRLALDLRAGYAFESSPVPPQTGETSYADGDKHTVSAGAGAELRGLSPLLEGTASLDAYAAVTLVPSRTDREAARDMTSGGRVLQAGGMARIRF